ncbi:shikimate kinase [Streptococcus pseudoporcinus]|uniref:Shikimate kinase n=1 Tax=Streptococcus pseudoporcinus TaxID=361101 RepID=A0A4U9XHP8_9STRE|nr:shikimate kinase [Streptococcus pseudoporcinus]VTS12683.1 shikimate kinase [Streptococcus pseudoporcinus]VUC65367.1 shikimate kinase [Streptococcus pseudoporcinus]VUC96234.1 shikimate kinase [Streptococcus pseudoporcinus]VUC96630.1 shikimate kinase [Streptococcus pseudoporcinus]
MNLILIGAQASGKMTIGQEVAKLTEMTLFHNHETIDFVLKFMPWSKDATDLITKIRFDFFETFAKIGQPMIFTIVIDFGDPKEVAFLDALQSTFEGNDQEVLFVELETSLEERLARNRTENRLKHKPLKRDIDWSEKDILTTMAYATFNSKVAPENLTHYYKINNTHKSVQEEANEIVRIMEKIEK